MFWFFLWFGLAYVVSVVLAYGASLAYWQRKYSNFARQHADEDEAFSLKISLLGPISLAVVAVETNFFKYGFMWRAER